MTKSDIEILNELRGSLKRDVTDEEIHAVREEIFQEYLRRDKLI
ncbi:MAG: hypothetical protein ACP5NW_02100 [Candidatus Woesearchaeota archaeon]